MCVNVYHNHVPIDRVTVATDSDNAGCPAARHSTSGGGTQDVTTLYTIVEIAKGRHHPITGRSRVSRNGQRPQQGL